MDMEGAAIGHHVRRRGSSGAINVFRSLSAGDASPGGHMARNVLEAIEAHQSAATRPPPLSRSATQDGLTCPICIDVLAAPVTLECGHTCCKSCFVLYLEKDQTKTVCPSAQCEIRRAVPKTNVTLQGLVASTYPERYQSKLDELSAEDTPPLLDARVEKLNEAGARNVQAIARPQALQGAVPQGALERYLMRQNVSHKSAAISCFVLLLAYAVGPAGLVLQPIKTSYIVKQYTSQPPPPSLLERLQRAPAFDDYLFPPKAPELKGGRFDNYEEWITSSDNFNYAWAMHIMPVRGLLLFVRFGNPEWANPLFPGIFTTTAGPPIERDAHGFAESIRTMSATHFWTTYALYPHSPLRQAMLSHIGQHHAGKTMSWGAWCLFWKWQLEDSVIGVAYISWLVLIQCGISVSSMMVQALILVPFDGFCTAMTTGMCGFWISLFKAVYENPPVVEEIHGYAMISWMNLSRQQRFFTQVLVRLFLSYMLPFGMFMAFELTSAACVAFDMFVAVTHIAHILLRRLRLRLLRGRLAFGDDGAGA